MTRQLSFVLVLLIAACTSADQTAVPEPPDAFEAACADEIRKELMAPETAQITFRTLPDRLLAQVITTNPDDGLTAQLEYTCEMDGSGGAVARLSAG